MRDNGTADAGRVGVMQAKINDGWQFPRIRCHRHSFNPDSPACCIGVAAVTDVKRDDDGCVFGVDYCCEFGHSWFMFVDDGEVRDLDSDRIVEDDREIAERWVCRQETNKRGNTKLVIWPVSTEICPHCGKGTRYDCRDCGEQLCADQNVHPEEDGFICDPCWWDRYTVPASEVQT